MYKAAKEVDPEHPPQDQMLIDLHNQLLAVRTDVKGVGEELGIEVNLLLPCNLPSPNLANW